jgi:hypothetical protein
MREVNDIDAMQEEETRVEEFHKSKTAFKRPH